MAHFAELDLNNTVLRVIVVGNQDCLDQNGNESEAIGIAFCQSLFGTDTRWIQTSYNNKIRKNYAGTGFTYDSDNEAFIPPRPYASWILNSQTYQWEPPIPYPTDNLMYLWDEDLRSWVNAEKP